MNSFMKRAPMAVMAAIIVTATPAAAQRGNLEVPKSQVTGRVYYPYPLFRANLEEGLAKNQAAVERCASSIADMRANDGAKSFDRIYVAQRERGLQVIGTVSFGASATEEFTCDIDYRGKIRKVQFG